MAQSDQEPDAGQDADPGTDPGVDAESYPDADADPGTAGRHRSAAAALRSRMVRRIAAGGGLTDPAWRAAFAEVPRHLFVPRYFRPLPGGGHDLLSAADPDPRRRLRWLAGAYADRPVATHVVDGELLSSSSQPSLMALMCQALDISGGERVLEIGAGTGYNAALLAHRLGAGPRTGAVTTVDLDERITAAARAHLAAYGTPAARSVTVVTGDGARGHRAGAPYDRVIVACELPSLPVALLGQCRPEARILAPFATGLVALTVRSATAAEGRFLSTPAFFVPLRGPSTTAAAEPAAAESTDRGSTVRGTGTPPRVIGNDLFRFLLTLLAGPLDLTWSPGSGTARLLAADGSAARTTPDGLTRISGPRDLWALVESAHTVFRDLGHPARTRFGLTVDGPRQWTWLDDPAGPYRWPVRTR
ncbi:Protein-L-isoaspartate O-methyltransferase [Actinacidiphila alni]|uniref:Protein-L-isoaspartate O-methyltransferase n=2 Tax=Actinacidiphila alni TaxID=380248 RepID=A0A1I2J8J3_9ACTN|nr:Protein-L-isoaspartate O-methyltransferase [Actinacidiphila alni]